MKAPACLVRLAGRLRQARDGAVAVEFALLGGFMIALILGTVQFGMAMQRYNALRSVAADTARYSLIQTSNNNALTPDQIRLYARAIAIASPYFVSQEGLQVTVTEPAVQPLTGVKQYTLNLRGQVNSITTIIGIDSFYITYSRPVFVPAGTTT